ncbi:MAG TPA: metallophosphoesterase family protein [Burkholderiales bacterium]|nr:metallophosphoesterase family protein [Burkholderiales bacterium]
MRLVAHLSDLHFGRVERSALEPLRRRVVELAPDLVVVSGDLTQRARARQFREARAFLDSLPGPQVVVPGNHDVPLYNVLARFLWPLAGFQRFITRNLEPSFVDDEIAVLGVNTARSFVFKGGRVSDAQLSRVARELCALNDEITKMVVTHHPYMALEPLAGCGVDVLMAGHLHDAHVVERVPGLPALMVQAGTATSSRTREQRNSFNLLRVDRGRIEVEQHVLNGAGFVRASAEAFERGEAGWIRSGPA